MKHDDMHVVAYKILKYLYESEMRGHEIDITEFAWESDLMSIPSSYWEQIINELEDKGYIKLKPTEITLEGVEFFTKNKLMVEANKFLGERFNVILYSIIGELIQ